MKQVLLKSVLDAFDYVMDHYYPAGLRELVQRSDTYAVISIQDTHTGMYNGNYHYPDSEEVSFSVKSFVSRCRNKGFGESEKLVSAQTVI